MSGTCKGLPTPFHFICSSGESATQSVSHWSAAPGSSSSCRWLKMSYPNYSEVLLQYDANTPSLCSSWEQLLRGCEVGRRGSHTVVEITRLCTSSQAVTWKSCLRENRERLSSGPWELYSFSGTQQERQEVTWWCQRHRVSSSTNTEYLYTRNIFMYIHQSEYTANNHTEIEKEKECSYCICLPERKTGCSSVVSETFLWGKSISEVFTGQWWARLLPVVKKTQWELTKRKEQEATHSLEASSVSPSVFCSDEGCHLSHNLQKRPLSDN